MVVSKGGGVVVAGLNMSLNRTKIRTNERTYRDKEVMGISKQANMNIASITSSRLLQVQVIVET